MNLVNTASWAWHHFQLPRPPSFKAVYENINLIQSLANGLLFARRFLESPTTVGSLVPSSQRLAERIVHYIPSREQSTNDHHYLEVGPGTGAFTEEIVKRLGDGDQLDLVELDATFYQLLKEKYSKNPNIHIHCLSIADWHPEYRYDAIISGLPLNSFSPEEVKGFIEAFQNLSKQEGTVSYFEYIALPYLKILALSPEQRMQFRRVLNIKEQFYKRFGAYCETVLQNFPPARIVHFKFSKIHEPHRTLSPLPNPA